MKGEAPSNSTRPKRLRHDAAYKRLFSHPEMVADLLRHWIAEPWTERVAWKTLSPAPAEFVGSTLRRSSSDSVWRFNLDDGRELYLILEFQSSADYWMAQRLLNYVLQLHQRVRRTERGRRLLPGVASAVVYNGKEKWNVPWDYTYLLEGSPVGASVAHVGFRYLLVDGRRANGETRESLVGLLFALERADEDSCRDLLRRLSVRLRGHPELRESFAAWLTQVLLPNRSLAGPISESEILEGDMIELPERISWVEEGRLKGVAQGLEQGLERGLEQGLERGLEQGLEQGRKRTVALAAGLLERRFGNLPANAIERLSDADVDQLEEWIQGAFTRPTLRDVFGD